MGLALTLAPAAGPVLAQVPAPAATPAPSADVKAARIRLDGYKGDLDQKERSLERDLSDADLQRLRQQTDPIADSIRGLLDELSPRLEAGRARLEQLGPKPKEGLPEESADVARERLAAEVASLMQQPARLAAMSEQARKLAQPDAVDRLVEAVLALAGGTRR